MWRQLDTSTGTMRLDVLDDRVRARSLGRSALRKARGLPTRCKWMCVPYSTVDHVIQTCHGGVDLVELSDVMYHLRVASVLLEEDFAYEREHETN